MKITLLPLYVSLGMAFCLGCNAPKETFPMIKSSGVTDLDSIPKVNVSPAVGDGQKLESNETIPIVSFDQLQAEIKQQAGKIVVVDVWSTSCQPCMEEFPNLIELSTKHPDQVVCISMNVDYIGLRMQPPQNAVPRVLEFLSTQAAGKVRHFISSTADADVLSQYEVDAIPAVIVYDTGGAIAARFTDSNAPEGGLTYAGQILPKIEEMLESAP